MEEWTETERSGRNPIRESERDIREDIISQNNWPHLCLHLPPFSLWVRYTKVEGVDIIIESNGRRVWIRESVEFKCGFEIEMENELERERECKCCQ